MKRKAFDVGGDVSRNAAMLAMLLILLCAFAMALPMLKRYQLSSDELASITKIGFFEPAQGPLDVVALVQKRTPANMPLYYIIAFYWSQLVGYSVFPLRLLSTLTGMVVLAWVYRLGCDVFDRRVALLAALLFSFSSLPVTRIHIIRMNPLVMLLAVAHTWFYWRLAYGKGGRRSDWLAFVISGGALVYTHPFAPLIIAGLGLHHLVFVSRSDRWRRVLLGWFGCAFLSLAALPLLLAGVAHNAVILEGVFSYTSGDLLLALVRQLVNHVPLLWLPLALGMGLALIRERGRVFAQVGFVALAGSLILVAFDAVAHYMDLRRLAYFISLWHLAIILVAAALVHLPLRRISVPVFVLVWLLAGINLIGGDPDTHPVDYSYRVRADIKDDYPPLHRYQQRMFGNTFDNDFLIGLHTGELVNLMLRISGGSFADYYLKQELRMDGVFWHASKAKYRLKPDTQAIIRARPYVILAGDPRAEMPNYGLARHHLEAEFRACPAYADEPDLHIQRFAHPLIGCVHESAAVVEYENGMRLIDRAVTIDPESDTISALLWWEIPDDSMLDDYNISLQLFAANGEKVAQIDRHLDGKLTPWGVTELATGDLPEGELELKLILYNRQDGVKVSGVDAATGESTKLLPLFDFEAAER